MDSSASAQATLHRLFQDDSNMKSNIVSHSQTQLELTSLDCNSAYQVMKDFDTGEPISVQHLSHGESLNEASNEVNDCSRTDNGVFSTEDVVNEDFIDDGEDDDDDHVEDLGEKFDEVNSDNRNAIDDSSQHRIIRCFSGYVECLLPDKEMEDNLGSKRKRSTPVKCFSDTNINSVKVKQKSKIKRKLNEEQHQAEEDNNRQHVQTQDILSHNEDHNGKLVNGTTNIVISTHEQHQHLQAQSEPQHNGVIEFIECKDMINENGTSDFSEFSSNCKDDEEFRNENNEPDLISENNEPDLVPDGKNNGNSKSEWDMLTWICSDCNKELPDVQALRQHHNIVHKQSPKYMCSQCSKVYTQYHCFFSHVKRHRNLVKYSCDECGKCFSNRKVLDMHLSTHSDSRPYLCTVCGKGFRQQSALYIHGRCHLPEEMKNRFACDECDKRFSTKPNLVTHKRIHTGVRNFTCDQCGKSFIQKGNLDAHLLTHSQDKPFSCDLCNKGFKTSMQLRKHQTVHTGAKPHQCDVCGRTFRERGTLREHHRIHTGAMPFTCEFCGKAFRFKGILTTHRRQHTGERPYSCLECQHHFTNWPNYNKHMKRRHGINTSRTTRTKATSDALPSQDQPQTQQQQDQTAEHVVQHIVPDTPPLYEDSISATPPEDLSNSGQTSAHFYQPAINVTMSAPMTATYHVASHPNMLSFYNLTQLQMDPPSLNSVNLNTPVDVIHSVSSVQQQLIHHR